MKPERKKQLEEEANNRTPEDNQIMHILYTHLVAAFAELAVAQEEAQLVRDERGERLVALAESLRQEIEATCDEVIDTIPGIMSKDEALEEMKQQQLKSWLDTAIRPEDEDELLH